ncbi:MAG: PKD domain-containing protein [Flavobacteriales bacterium]
MKKHLLFFALFLSAGQLAFAQDVNISGTVLCPDGTQFTSDGINYIFLSVGGNGCCTDSIGVPLDENGSFDYSFVGEIEGIFSLWYADSDGYYVVVPVTYDPDNMSFVFEFNACEEIVDPCVVDITFEGDSQLEGETLIYLETTTNVVDPIYLWEFGDGGTSTDPNPVHVYNEIGTYTICVSVTGGGCTASDCIDITVDAEGNGQEGGGMMVQGFTLIVNGGVSSTSELTTTEISVYPNPISSGNSIFVNSPQALRGEMTLYSGAGVLLEKSTMTLASGTTVLPLNMNQLTPGVYFLQLRDQSGKTHQFKLIY